MFVLNCQNNKTKREITHRFGKLAARTWKRLSDKKYVSKFNSLGFRKMFYRKIYFIFSKLLYNVDYKKIKFPYNFERLAQFMKCLPSVKFLIKYVLKIEFSEANKKEVVFIKFVMEMLEHYLRKFDYPLYNVNQFFY